MLKPDSLDCALAMSFHDSVASRDPDDVAMEGAQRLKSEKLCLNLVVPLTKYVISSVPILSLMCLLCKWRLSCMADLPL